MSGLTVAVMAGGKSSRMGTDKSFVRLLGRPLIEHVLARVDGLGQDATIIVTNRPDDYAYLSVPLYGDVLPDRGSLGGIYSAIWHSRSTHTLIVACDMPFLNRALLAYMLGLRSDDHDVIVPRVDGYPESLHAVYSRACLEPIRRRLEANQLKVIGFHADVRVRPIDEAEYAPFDPRGLSFTNVNTPDELEAARRMAGEGELPLTPNPSPTAGEGRNATGSEAATHEGNGTS